MSGPVLEAWEVAATADSRAIILPDGCRDLIFIAKPGVRPLWRITDLDDAAYGLPIRAGSYFRGYRLRPGVSVNHAGLLQAMHGLRPDDGNIEARIDSFTAQDPLVTDALASLEAQACGGSVFGAARALGIAPRRLQRAMRHTGRGAARWLALARGRKAARMVVSGGGLADIAHDFGYADQPHMSREFSRWFGTSPGRLRGLPELWPPLAASGFG